MKDFEKVNENMLKITGYTLSGKLPDPFLSNAGVRTTDRSGWEDRRKEIYDSAVTLQYGALPPEPEFLECEPLYTSHTFNTYLIHTGTRKHTVTFRMQVILPQKRDGNVPVIVDGDLCWGYYMDKDFISAATDHGIGWVFFDRTEIAHDICGEGREKGELYKAYPGLGFGALGAWAWGYSRCVDALEKLPLPTDHDFIVFTGHSRGGKTVAIAGAVDKRARIVNPNETCAGACGCYRIHMTGEYEDKTSGRSETLKDLWGAFPFWLGEGMGKYAEDEASLPFDCHYLKALVAPRTLLVSEAAGDFWANPVGSWQTTLAAKEVFDFLGAGDNLFWYFRPGVHGHTVADIKMLVNVIEHQKTGKEIDPRMFCLPFKPVEPAFDWRRPDASAFKK